MAALRSTRLVPPLSIVPRGLDLVKISLGHCWIWFRLVPIVSFHYLLLIKTSCSLFFSFLIRFRFYLRTRRLISHPRRLHDHCRTRDRAFSKISRGRTSCTRPCGLVAGSNYIEFVVLLFPFQLTFLRVECLYLSYSNFVYKNPAPGLVKGIKDQRLSFPSLSLFLCELDFRRPTRTTTQPNKP